MFVGKEVCVLVIFGWLRINKIIVIIIVNNRNNNHNNRDNNNKRL